MRLFDKVLEKIENSAKLKAEGKFNGIPYPYKRFSEYVPSIDRETVIGVTSYTGAAKSKFTRYTYVLYPYEFSIQNNYPLLIDYYALEDSAEKVFKNILCHYMYMKHKVNINLFDLDSKFRSLSSKTLECLKAGENYLQDFSNHVRIKDSLTHPFAIHQDIIKTANTLGELESKTVTDKTGKEYKQYTNFKPKDDTHWMMICDNLNNIDKERHHFDKKEAMDSFVQKDCRMLYSKIFKMTCIIIHQQALEAERSQFTDKGKMIIDKIKPSLANLGGTKEVVRSYHMVLSLFAPHKFKIPNYKGYDIERLGNNFRELEVLKNNDGWDNVSTPLYFDGGAEVFSELPNATNEVEGLNKFYQWLQNERFMKKSKTLFS